MEARSEANTRSDVSAPMNLRKTPFYYLLLTLGDVSPVGKVCDVDVEREVGQQAEEERLEVGVDHVAELPVELDLDGDVALVLLVDQPPPGDAELVGYLKLQQHFFALKRGNCACSPSEANSERNLVGDIILIDVELDVAGVGGLHGEVHGTLLIVKGKAPQVERAAVLRVIHF